MSFFYFSGLAQYVCFAILGFLTARHISDEAAILAGGAFAGVVLAAAGSLGIAAFLHAANAAVRKQQGFAGTWQSVNRGFVMLFPFTALALIAELALDWNAVQVFASAGIMTSGATMGAELAKASKPKFLVGLLPTGSAFVLSAAWMILAALSGSLIG